MMGGTPALILGALRKGNQLRDTRKMGRYRHRNHRD